MKAQEGLSELPKEDFTTSGHRIHEWLANHNVGLVPMVQLNDEELSMAERCEAEAQRLVQALLVEIGPIERFDEVELYVVNVPGHADRVYKAGDTGLVIDFKTGRNRVETAETNLQLAHYAVGAAYGFDVNKVYVAVIQPYCGEPLVAHYRKDDLVNAEYEIARVMEEARKPDAPRIPSLEACRYCKANGTLRCPESTTQLQTFQNTSLLEHNPDESDALLISPLVYRDLLDRCALAEITIKRIRESAKKLIKEGTAIPNYALKPGHTLTHIDVEKAWACLADKLQPDAFTKCLRINKGDLEDICKRAAISWNVLEPAITTKQAEPSLERTK
jgi:hypothetical protein